MTLRIGDIAPDFIQESTQGKIHFYDWSANHWVILFSHPKDFTPVCTTELGEASRLKPEFDRRNVKVLGLSVDSVSDHLNWSKDISDTQNCELNFPLLADADRKVSELYDMIHPHADDTFTVRSVYIIDPRNKIRLIMTYPASTGRNFSEILRVLDSLQLTDLHPVVTPANWKKGDDVLIIPSMQDEVQLKKIFPSGFKMLKPYLRFAPSPD